MIVNKMLDNKLKDFLIILYLDNLISCNFYYIVFINSLTTTTGFILIAFYSQKKWASISLLHLQHTCLRQLLPHC